MSVVDSITITSTDTTNQIEITSTDGITVTPLLFSKENSGSTADETGIVLKTEFSF